MENREIFITKEKLFIICVEKALADDKALIASLPNLENYNQC